MDVMNDPPPPRRPDADQGAETDGAVMQTELAADLTAARQARSAIREALAAWRMEHLSGDAELLASGLVANAAEHGDGKPISLALRRQAEPGGQPGITCEVTDTAPQPVRRLVPGPDAERGRGLAIVAALAQSSGVRTSQAGKTSWFTLALTDRTHRIARQLEHEPEAGMRWSEAIGLRPQFVHADQLGIEWKLYEQGRFYLGRPKDGSIRPADLPPFLAELLASHIAARGGRTCTCRNPEPPWCPGDRYVFLGPGGATSGGRATASGSSGRPRTAGIPRAASGPPRQSWPT
jgi:anti-sigma regulatory factor (Ser/Thr protein kinase)